ncbi:DNA (cytosine-5-)-methyltransferase [archaeon]|jgi:DNA (cytosine-5)-methyltransferase 1|nr:DNA (cytosine-5-)-methyltransferase [archaeon]MBT4532155.1 DNA (cytosine-5-)-methyltransferase [archaeon]
MRKIKTGSFFCGCGGSDLGLIGGFKYLNKKYKKLPFHVNYAVDIDKKAVETYNHNFKHNAIVKSISECKHKDMPEMDLVIGGFPCQSFSTVNPTKNPFDERGQLYKELAKVLKEKKPKAFIAENVKGLMVLKKGSIFKRVLTEFKKQGYELNYKLLHSADFGIPQKRQRVFIVGIRNDLNIKYEFPKNTHSNDNELNTKGWVPLSTVIDSLVHKNDKYYFSKKAVEGMKKAKNNMKRGLYQDLNKPCLTITSHLAKVSLNSRDPVLLVKPEEELYRRFSPREAARIQSFPDEFEFLGSQGDAYRQIGNAIPPVLMWHVAKALNEQVFQNTSLGIIN